MPNKNEYSFENPQGGFLVRSDRLVSLIAATLTLHQQKHEGITVVLNDATGSTVTLPTARGTGDRYRLFVGTALSSGSNVLKVANSSDYMRGRAVGADGTSAVSFPTANTGTPSTESDTVTFNGSTTGGLVGDVIEVEDVAANLWHVEVMSTSTGTAATPFSETV